MCLINQSAFSRRQHLFKTISKDYLVQINDDKDYFNVNGNTVFTLPDSRTLKNGFEITIKKIDKENTVTIRSHKNDSIDSISELQIENKNDYVKLGSDGKNFFIIGQSGTISLVGDISFCPKSFIRVPANSDLEVKSFCVSKYEMRGRSGAVKATSEGSPIVNVNARDAYKECKNMKIIGTEKGAFSLITNPQWMTIARNIELVDSNWSGGTVGNGSLARGWASNIRLGDSFQNSKYAPKTSNSCLYNIEKNSCGNKGNHLNRRTLSLSNNEVIWDLSGNVWEWVDWSDKEGFNNVPAEESTIWKEFSDHSNASITENDYKPIGSYTSSNGVGMWFGGSGGALRGGIWDDGPLAGVYALNMSHLPGVKDPDIGFRCVWQVTQKKKSTKKVTQIFK